MQSNEDFMQDDITQERKGDSCDWPYQVSLHTPKNTYSSMISRLQKAKERPV